MLKKNQTLNRRNIKNRAKFTVLSNQKTVIDALSVQLKEYICDSPLILNTMFIFVAASIFKLHEEKEINCDKFFNLSQLISHEIGNPDLKNFLSEIDFPAKEKIYRIFKQAQQNIIKIDSLDYGYLYENMIHRDFSKKEGIFYTPKELVDYIFKSANNYLETENPKILDPACGSGIFLNSGFDYLFEKSNYTSTAQKNIFGIDKDSYATQLARLLLYEKCNKSDSQYLSGLFLDNILTADTLLDITAESHPDFKDFDLIVGNPPYGISRDEKITSEENKQLKNKYSDYISGKPEKYLLFMAKGMELLKEGGVLSFVVPNSWLGVNGAKKVRELLIHSGSLCEITTIDYPAFESAQIETVIFLAKKNAARKQLILKRLPEKFKLTNESIAPYTHIQESEDLLIPSYWCKEAEDILKKVFNKSINLDNSESPFQTSIALQAYCVGKGTPKQTREDVKNHIYHYDRKFDEDTFPYLEGSDVKRDSINWSGSYLRYGTWLSEFQPIQKFSSPRILLREIIGAPPNLLIAAFTEDIYLYNRSLLHIMGKNYRNARALKIFTSLLNSPLYSLIVALRGKKSQRRLFPKILNDDLRKLPVPKNICNESNFYDQDLDSSSLVEKFYGIHDKEQNRIVELLKGLPWAQKSLI